MPTAKACDVCNKSSNTVSRDYHSVTGKPLGLVCSDCGDLLKSAGHNLEWLKAAHAWITERNRCS